MERQLSVRTFNRCLGRMEEHPRPGRDKRYRKGPSSWPDLEDLPGEAVSVP